MRWVAIAAAFGIFTGSTLAWSADTAKTQKPVGGLVNSNGSVQGAPTQFTVSHPTAGEYDITFMRPFPKFAICLPQPLAAATQVSGLTAGQNTCSVIFTDSATGARKDAQFVFIAVNAG